MCPQPGNSPGSLLGVTYSPWMAAKNHQLAVLLSARAIMARTPIAYQCRSALLKVPPAFQAFLRVKVATFHLSDWPFQGAGLLCTGPVVAVPTAAAPERDRFARQRLRAVATPGSRPAARAPEPRRRMQDPEDLHRRA